MLSRSDHPSWPAVEATALGLIGVFAFSLTLPATRAAVPFLGAYTVGFGRSAIAAVLAAGVLWYGKVPFPGKKEWPGLIAVAVGVVFGFPVFSALALRQLPSAQAAVVVGLIPAATAGWSFVRTRERPSVLFLVAALGGVLAVLGFAATEGAGGLRMADVWLGLAVVLGGLGYSEGGHLAKTLGAIPVISWALVISAPVTAAVAIVSLPRFTGPVPSSAWLGFAYVSLVSAYLGFFAWYRGLALGDVSKISQLQLVQPVMTVGWSALLLGENVSLATIGAACVVVVCAAFTQRGTAQGQAPSPASGR